jgi:hypothetical protein
MPGLAPCYVATERALIIGWNPASVRKALDVRVDDSPALGAASGAVIRLDRIAAADRLLARAQPVELQLGELQSGESRAGEPPPREYPWRAITAKGAREGAGYRLQLRDAGRGST